MEIVTAHKGFVWLDINTRGVTSHGSRADLGVDAVCKAGYVLVELDKLAQKLRPSGHGEPGIHTNSAYLNHIRR
jgi:acetylornithine deacetylase/succinyl-diaminopimelate desuccinylase-like protein